MLPDFQTPSWGSISHTRSSGLSNIQTLRRDIETQERMYVLSILERWKEQPRFSVMFISSWPRFTWKVWWTGQFSAFHVTSPKFNPRNYPLFWVYTFMTYFLCKQIFGSNKGSSFCDRGLLNFQALAWRGIQLVAGKAIMWVKNVTDFLSICYLNILCLSIDITLIFMSSSREEFTH